MQQPVIMSTAGSAYFANLLAGQLPMAIERIPTDYREFGDGERYFRAMLEERTDLFGRNVVFVGSTHTDQAIEEAYRVGGMLAKSGTKRRIFVIPFLGYSTMERAVLPGEVVSAKAICRQLSTIPGAANNFFLFLDLHVPGLVYYFEGDCQAFELYVQDVLIEAVQLYLKFENISRLICGSADLGRIKRVKKFARTVGDGKYALVDKDRDFEDVSVSHVFGNVRGRAVLIYDDMIRSAKTIAEATDAYIEAGADAVIVATSHLALTGQEAFDRLMDSRILKVIATNSHPESMSARVRGCDKFVVVDASGVFAPVVTKILES